MPCVFYRDIWFRNMVINSRCTLNYETFKILANKKTRKIVDMEAQKNETYYHELVQTVKVRNII